MDANPYIILFYGSHPIKPLQSELKKRKHSFKQFRIKQIFAFLFLGQYT